MDTRTDSLFVRIRPDTNFDELIKKIYGDVSSLERHEEEENAQLNKQNILNNEYFDAESVKRRIMHQNEQRVSCTCLMNHFVMIDVDRFFR